MANGLVIQGPGDNSNHRRELDIERMAIELDEFVNEVSLELSVIGRQLGQTPDVRTAPRLEVTPQKPTLPERTPLAERRPLNASLPAEKRVTDNRPQTSKSRIQAIRNRLAKVNPGRIGDERGTRENE